MIFEAAIFQNYGIKQVFVWIVSSYINSPMTVG